MAALVEEEEQAATSKMRSQGANEKELNVYSVVEWVLVLHQSCSHGPGRQDVEASEDQGPADLSSPVDLLFCFLFSQRHCDPGVGEHMEKSPANVGEPFAVGSPKEFLWKAQKDHGCLILDSVAVEEVNGAPPEDDRQDEEKCSVGV